MTAIVSSRSAAVSLSGSGDDGAGGGNGNGGSGNDGGAGNGAGGGGGNGSGGNGDGSGNGGSGTGILTGGTTNAAACLTLNATQLEQLIQRHRVVERSVRRSRALSSDDVACGNDFPP